MLASKSNEEDVCTVERLTEMNKAAIKIIATGHVWQKCPK